LTGYTDIKVREDRVMHTVEFNWEDHAVVMLFQTIQAVETLNAEYTHALEYTNGKIGDTECDTRPVRDALQKYVQRMYGVFHDDYPYDQLNRILPLMHKTFLKKMACFPERLTSADYWRMRNYEHLSCEDIVHYGNLVFEVRRVTELTFAMRALAKLQAS
jgi:sestrin